MQISSYVSVTTVPLKLLQMMSQDMVSHDECHILSNITRC